LAGGVPGVPAADSEHRKAEGQCCDTYIIGDFFGKSSTLLAIFLAKVRHYWRFFWQKFGALYN
jgi:hypothetical protein